MLSRTLTVLRVAILLVVALIVGMYVRYQLAHDAGVPTPGYCVEAWSCGDWGECFAGYRNRTCVDANNCGTTVERPVLSTMCGPATTPPSGTPPPSGRPSLPPPPRGFSPPPTFILPPPPGGPPPSLGSVHIKRVGQQLTVESAPGGTNGTSAWIDVLQATTENPAFFFNLQVGNHTSYVSFVQNYSVHAGICTYAQGEAECSVTTFPIAPNCNSAFCNAGITVSAGNIVKIVYQYLAAVSPPPPPPPAGGPPPPPPVNPPPTGLVEIKRVGYLLTPESVPGGTNGTSAWVDVEQATNENPAFFANLDIGNHTSYTSFVPNYSLDYAICSYPIGGSECSVIFTDNVPNCNASFCNAPVTVSTGNVVKIVYRYLATVFPPPPSPPVSPPPGGPPPPPTGSAEVMRVGSDLTTDSAPGGTNGTAAWLDALQSTTANPAFFLSQPVGTHASFVTFVSGYSVSAGTCVYAIGAPECVVTIFNTTGITCTTSYCSKQLSVAQGRVGKIVYRYVSNNPPPPPVVPPPPPVAPPPPSQPPPPAGPPPPLTTVSITVIDPDASELGQNEGSFRITRTGSLSGPLTVTYSISANSAVNGSDYNSITNSRIIPSNISSATVIIAPINDEVLEGDETVTLTIQPSGSYTVGTPSSATLTIQDYELTFNFGTEELVFHSTSDGVQNNDECPTVSGWDDLPDVPARAVRTPAGRIRLISGNSRGNFAMQGNTFTVGAAPQLHRECSPTPLDSHFNTDPSLFDYQYWILGVYRDPNTSHPDRIYAIVHHEYHDTIHVPPCTSLNSPCWYNAILSSYSDDGGQTFSPPTLIAALPYPWNWNLSSDPGHLPPPPHGYFPGTNIIKKADGFYYSFVSVSYDPLNLSHRTCLMRTSDLSSPTSWRFWNGSSFSLQPINPYGGNAATYQAVIANPSQYICAPINSGNITDINSSITFNTYLQKYIMIGGRGGGATSCGLYYSLSSDLFNWSIPRLFRPGNLPQCNSQAPVDVYPSLIDQSDMSTNFENSDNQFHLYFTHGAGAAHDLKRVPITICETGNPAPGCP